MSQLRDKTAKGFFWTGLDNFGRQILTVIFSILLMRLLTPADFGIVAQALSFVGLSQILINGGFGWALIQKKEIDEEDLSTVFWTNIGIGLILFAVFFAIAPLIENFYDNEGLTMIVRVLSFGFIIASLNVVQRTIYQRDINFKKLSIVNLSGFGIGNIAALIAAYSGMGEWSLVILYLTNFTVASILLWSLTDFIPSFKFSIPKLKELSAFSFNVLGFQSLNFFAAKGDKIIIGKFLGEQALGIYESTYKIFIKSVVGLTTVFQKVLFPAFSKIQDQKEKITEHLLSIIDLISIVLFPLLMIGAVIAEPLVLTLFGEKWEAMIFIFRVFCLISFFLSVNPIITSTLLALNKSRLVLRLNLLNKTIFIIMVFVGVNYGINGVAISWLISSSINFFIKVFFSVKIFEVSFWQFLEKMLLNTFFALLIGAILIVVLSSGIFPEANLAQLIIGGLIGGILFTGVLFFRKKKEINLLKKKFLSKNA